ncbi:hypothetical protein IBX65_02850 [Candidatus Aerophobetes bacterium]|nr:hypothetical protein [Candidatus Aerophobetes bacterium]
MKRANRKAYSGQKYEKGKESEWARSIFHAGSGIAIALIYYLTGITKNWTLVVLGAIALFFLAGDISRQFMPKINHLVRKIFKPVMREYENTKIAASSYYVIGCWLAIFLFAREVACICILFLAIGDTFSKMLRQILKKEKTFYRPLMLISLNFLISFLIAYSLLKTTAQANSILPSFLGALGATAGEMVPKIDNLTIPVLGGILLTAGLYLIG